MLDTTHLHDTAAALGAGTVATVATGGNNSLLVVILTLAAPLLKEFVLLIAKKLHTICNPMIETP
jgi:hypothetical protein